MRRLLSFLVKRQTTQKIRLKGEIRLVHKRGGKVLSDKTIKNLIVNAGIAEVAGLINGVTSGAFTYLAIGTGTTSPTTSDTALEAEISTGGGERAAATASRVTTTVTNDTAQLVHEWTFTSSFAVTEAAPFDAASAGNMLARQTFSAINVVSGDKLEVTYKVQVS